MQSNFSTGQAEHCSLMVLTSCLSGWESSLIGSGEGRMKLKNPGQRSKTGCTKSAGCVGVESRTPKMVQKLRQWSSDALGNNKPAVTRIGGSRV